MIQDSIISSEPDGPFARVKVRAIYREAVAEVIQTQKTDPFADVKVRAVR